MVQSINQLKAWFVTLAKPTQQQFWDWLDSYRHKSEKIEANDLSQALLDIINAIPPAESLQELINLINSKPNFSDLEAEINARIAGDNQLQTNIDSEAATRQNEDYAINQRIDAIIDGVPDAGNSLQKLYNLILQGFEEITVPDIPSRDALDIQLGWHVFVVDDGDGKWALYKAITAGVNATYVKLSDPDLLNQQMTASQIKQAYESNPDTNAFTNALLTKLNGIQDGATKNATDAQLRDRSTHTGIQAATTISTDGTHRFVTDAQIAAWNGKADQSEVDALKPVVLVGVAQWAVPGDTLIEKILIVDTAAVSFSAYSDNNPANSIDQIDINTGWATVAKDMYYQVADTIHFVGIGANTKIKIFKR